MGDQPIDSSRESYQGSRVSSIMGESSPGAKDKKRKTIAQGKHLTETGRMEGNPGP